MSFSNFGLHADILRGVQDACYVEATPIQRDAIPAGLSGKDVLACSATGSGKTAAFLLPILQRLHAHPKPGVTRALILTPTRELAAQIGENLKNLARHTGITAATVVGGVGMGGQKHALQKGAAIVVATPGRLMDHLRFPYAKLGGVEMLVLDEADRMLDMGFLPDIKKIVQHLPATRQTYFFSATLPPEIVSLTKQWLHEPARINIERQARPAEGIRQSVYPVPQSLKSMLLVRLLKNEEMKSVLVFTRTKRRADRVADVLKRNNVSSAKIHGDRTQGQRTQAMEGFKKGRYKVLVATDVAARGIDVNALSHVINFDLPGSSEDYIHRIGRTARAQATGDALTFVSPDEEREWKSIERAVQNAGGKAPVERVKLEDFDYTAIPPSAERHPSGSGRQHERRERFSHDRGDGNGHRNGGRRWQHRGEGQDGARPWHKRRDERDNRHRPAGQGGPNYNQRRNEDRGSSFRPARQHARPAYAHAAAPAGRFEVDAPRDDDFGNRHPETAQFTPEVDGNSKSYTPPARPTQHRGPRGGQHRSHNGQRHENRGHGQARPWESSNWKSRGHARTARSGE
ncbi:MAG TPA: DEAD/DEAH box helicase [Planctomycetota bacterium]|nr:DEAD/DEAH box helicase [Planctomycetota bacterium]